MKIIKAIIGLLMMAGGVWGLFFSFHLFPWEGSGLKWWYIPHLATSLCIAAPIIVSGWYISTEG